LLVIPAKAGRSAKRGEHPKDGPKGERSESSSFSTTREALDIRFCVFAQRISLDPGLRRDDEQKRSHCATNYLSDLLTVLGGKTWGQLWVMAAPIRSINTPP
jgi:hypothetical protein